MLDFTSLRHFLALVEAGSFSKAAQRLFVTQPAVSHQIRELEKQLGLRLVSRGHGQIELTDPGKYLYEFCQDLFVKLEEAESRIQDLRATVRGTIRIGTPMGVLDGWLLPLLVGFHAAHPDVEYQIVVGTDETMRELLIERRIDVALLLEGVSRHLQQLDHMPIFQEEYMLLSSGATHKPRARPRPLEISELPFIVYQEHDFMLNHWLAANTKKRAPIQIRHILNHIPGIISFVKAGLGVAVLPRHAVRAELADGSLVELPPPVRRVTNMFHLAYKKQRFLPLKIRMLAEWLQKASNLEVS
jgi:DNA-binding transcriptional LysR family regulator